mmetsp:Transcript_71295/g.82945  ORF Transcript_71295/g.82945 Transcript_71295/m.82945 type:complete len:210 (+) Transcript_71295:32-661(+)
MTAISSFQIPSFTSFNREFVSQISYKVKTHMNEQCTSPKSIDSGKDSDDSLSTSGSLQSLTKINSKKSYKEQTKKSYKMKQKTELCKTYSLGLVCPYGNNCSFAHGAHELKTKVMMPPKYKTTKCRDFHQTGFCKFGLRCQFIHLEKEAVQATALPKMSYSNILQTLESAPESGSTEPVESFLRKSLNLPAYNLPRLSVFEQIATPKWF